MRNWNIRRSLARTFAVAALVVGVAIVIGAVPASARRVIDTGGDGDGGGFQG